MTTETKSSELRELVLQRPLTKGSRGRNGAFTATVVTLYAYNGREGGALPFLAIEGSSRRQGRQAPLQLGLSLEDAMLLAEEIVQAVRAVLPQPPLVHAFDFRGQAKCGSSNDVDGDAPASHDPAEVTCPACREAARA